MTATNLSAPWHERARAWRENIARMSRRELSARIGISESQISNIELGADRRSGAPIEDEARLRYELLCAAVTLGVERFDFTGLSAAPVMGVSLAFVLPPQA